MSGVSLAELLKRRTSAPAASKPTASSRRPVYSLPVSAFDPTPGGDSDFDRAGETLVGPTLFGADQREPHQDHQSAQSAREALVRPRSVAERIAVPTPPAGIEVSVPATAPRPPGHLTPEQTFNWWLSRMLAGEAQVIETWPRIFLAARSIGLTRLGRRHYTQAAFRRACERLVREGRAVPFWYVTRGRPPMAVATMAHLWAFALAGFHRRLGRRDQTARARDGLQDCVSRPRSRPTRAAVRASGEDNP